MSYTHKGWVIDGWTDWLVRAFGKGASERSFTVSNSWTKPNTKPPHRPGSFPRVACRETASRRKIWHSFVFFDECLRRLSFRPPAPSSIPFPTDRSFPRDTWGNQQVLIGLPFARLIRPFHSRQLWYFPYSFWLSNSPTPTAIPPRPSSLSPFAITRW